MEKKLNVLVLKNNWDGVYNAFDSFYRELCQGLKKNNINFSIANNLDEAKKMLQKTKFDFSIYIGVYDFIDAGIPLFEKYQLLNYQWVIDNPYVYKCLPKSKYNRLIMIDEDFYLSGDYFDKNGLVLSLGAPETYFNNKNKIDAILVPWRLKKFSDIKATAEKFGVKDELNDFIAKSNLKGSFHRQFNDYLKNNKILKTEELFRVANDYFRLYKRIQMLNSIKKHKLVITSDTPNEDLINDNITYIKPVNFDEIEKMQKQYKYVLNANPNYDNCLHDRVSHSVVNGAVVISDKTPFLEKIHFPLCFDFDNFKLIDECIDDIANKFDDVLSEQRKCIEKFSISNQIKKIVKNYYEFK